MGEPIGCDICVIGGGSGGLSVAAGAAQMGARVVLIEKGKMGGDCLNYGCVPSKALIAAAAAAQCVRGSGRFGIVEREPEVRFGDVHAHVHGVIAAIAPHDSVERFEGLGVRVIQAAARFIGPDTVEAGALRVRARRFVIATGSSPAVPPIPGLDAMPYLTNETIFDLTERPEHLVVIGGGPIGAELAQAHRRLGARVTIVEGLTLLNRDDPEAVDVVRSRLVAEGIDLVEGASAKQVAPRGSGVAVTVEREGQTRTIEGSHLLVAVGRRANVDGLGLDAAGIELERPGIKVDARLRTTNRRVFAIGDVAGPLQFTHVAGYHAGIVIRNALFRLPAKADHRAVPRVTYTAPELAHVGASEAEARAIHGDKVRIARWALAENDRAQAERETEGFVKVVTDRAGRVLGATVVGTHAGELIGLWVLAVGRRMRIGAVAGIILPYPTIGEASKRAAGAWYAPVLFGPRTRRIVRALGWLP